MTSKKEQLLCQYHEWPCIWENKKSPPVQTERVKETRKRKQTKRFDSFNQWLTNWIRSTKKGLLGTRNPEVLLNTLWLNSTMHFGLRGSKEHRDMCWGDVNLKETADRNIWNLMKDIPKQEPVQTATISGQCCLKCLPLMHQKKIL